MTTEDKFVAELQSLLNKYNVEMYIDDYRVAFWAPERYDENDEPAMAQIDFKTRWMAPED